MKQFIDLFNDILENGVDTMDRTGVGRRRVFGRQLRFDLSKGEFPLVTTRKMFVRGIIEELLWFLSGIKNTQPLIDKNVHIWDSWRVKEEHLEAFAKKTFSDEQEQLDYIAFGKQHLLGSIGNLYGSAFRYAPVSDGIYPVSTNFSSKSLASDHLKTLENVFFNEELKKQNNIPDDVTFEDVASKAFAMKIDQMHNLINNLKERPYSSRHVVSAWIPEWVADESMSPQENVMSGRGALAPCHVLQQYFVLPPLEEGGRMRISLMMTQRSLDTGVGGPTNVASYSLLLMMIAQCVDMVPNEFIWSIGDAHIYQNQIEVVKEQITREPLPLCTMFINPEVKDLFSFTADDFKLINYVSHPALKYEVAV